MARLTTWRLSLGHGSPALPSFHRASVRTRRGGRIFVAQTRVSNATSATRAAVLALMTKQSTELTEQQQRELEDLVDHLWREGDC